MFRGEALTTDNQTACRFDTAEAEWKSDLLFARCKSHRLRKGKAQCAPNHDGAGFPLAHDHPCCPGNVPTAEVPRTISRPGPPYDDTCGPGRDGFRAMLDAAGAQPGPKGLRDVALLRLLHDLGLRRSEAVRLDVEDVDLPGKRISLLSRGRSWKEPVTLPEPTRAALAAWLEACGSEPGPLFVNFDRAGKGHRLTGTAVYHIVGWLGAKAGLTVRPQELRHLAITTALDRTNGDMRAVAKFSRHKDLRTLSRYRDNRPDLAGKVASLVAAE